MDVAIVATARFPISEPFAGGTEAHTHVLATRLARRGHDVTVYAAAGGHGEFRVEPMLPVSFAASDRARRDVNGAPATVVAEHHSYLDAMLRLSASSHDVVHLNAVHHLPFACAGLLPAPVTGTLHCPPTPWLESALSLAAGNRRRPELASVSRTNAAAWSPVPVDRIIPNGVDLERWTFGDGGDAAVWTGRMAPEKAPHLAIDACRLAGIPLRLLGPRHDPDYFDREVAPRLGDGVEYLGHAGVDDTAEIVRTSAVAVVTPTWEEPFGLIIAEALASGTPVAAFRRGAVGELLDHRTGVLAEPDDVDSLARAIGLAAGLDRHACRQRAALRFSADAMADAYESWFGELVSGPRGDDRAAA